MSTESAFSANMRIRVADHDVQVTVRGDSQSEFNLHWAELAENMQTFVESVNLVAGAGNAAPLVANSAPPNPWVTPTPPAPAAPAADPWASTPVAPTPAPQDAPLCDHGQPRKFVPAGTSKKTGQPYQAFWACQHPDRNQQCKTVRVA